MIRVTSEQFDIKALVTAELMTAIGDLQITRIRRRTTQGQSSTGASFAPLSKSYAAQKQKALGNSKADLTVSGRMLNDMHVTEVTRNSAAITFASQGPGTSGGTFIQRSRSMGANDKAYYHQEGGRVLRPFFEGNDEDEQAIAVAVEQYLDRTLPD